MNISAFTKLAAASTALALAAVLFFPATFHSSVLAKESPPFQMEIPASSGVLMLGEELIYNVSYSIFDLGEVKVQIIDTATKGGIKIYKTKAFIDSYSGVPFVDLHQVFYSEVTQDFYSRFFTVHNTAKPEEMPYTQYAFDYENKKAHYEIGVKPKNITTKKGTETITDYQQDGLSLFYFSRNNVHEKKKIKTPIFINEKSFFTEFNFMNKIGLQEIDAVEYPIETVEFDGNANFIGIFGLTGYFRGFFSNDDASVPIVAKMKVLVGSIHIELIKWNRPGWIPPIAKK
ncbi:MAG: DUF3108 domain-containing protein [Bacteroidota bacterium]